MTIVHDFDYVRVTSPEEAVQNLVGRPGAVLLAGGTDLVPWLRDDLVRPELVVDLKEIPDLDALTFDGFTLSLGPLVTFSNLIASPVVNEHFPLLIEMAVNVASTGIRNRATIVGNICSALPSCDAGPALLVYDATVHVLGRDGKREIPITGWFLGPRKTALRPGEVVTGVTLSQPEHPHDGAFLKLARYSGEDLAQASVAILALEGARYRVAFGAVAPVPLRARHIEDVLAGGELGTRTLADAQRLVAGSISPITDIRATKEYREHMCRVMLERALHTADARRNGHGPPYGRHPV